MGFRWKKKTKVRKPPSRRSMLVAGILFALIGGIPIGIFAPRAIGEWNLRRTWVETPCRIVTAEYEEAGHTPGRKRKRDLYTPKIVYRYTVAGREYTSARYSLTEHRIWASTLNELMAKYKPGTRHTCLVNPSDPTTAVLDAFTPSNLFWVLLGTPWLIFGGVALVRAVRPR